jgi:hypothetical protein
MPQYDVCLMLRFGDDVTYTCSSAPSATLIQPWIGLAWPPLSFVVEKARRRGSYVICDVAQSWRIVVRRAGDELQGALTA